LFVSQTLRAFFSFFYLLQQRAKQKQSDSDTDGRISYIKSRPVIGAQVKVQKVDNRTKTQPVNKIADCTTGDQSKSINKNPGLLFQVLIGKCNNNKGCSGNPDKKNLPQPCFIASQKSKGCSGISNIDQIKKTRCSWRAKVVMTHNFVSWSTITTAKATPTGIRSRTSYLAFTGKPNVLYSDIQASWETTELQRLQSSG